MSLQIPTCDVNGWRFPQSDLHCTIHYCRICMDRIYVGLILNFGGLHAGYRGKNIDFSKLYIYNIEPIQYISMQVHIHMSVDNIQKESFSANSIGPIVTANDLPHSI